MDIPNLVGLAGALLILGAFWLVTRDGPSKPYYKLNLLGSALLLYNADATHTPAFIVLNAVWMGVAIKGLVDGRSA